MLRIKARNRAVDDQIGQLLKPIFDRLHEPDFGAMIPSALSTEHAIDWLCSSNRADRFRLELDSAVSAGKPSDAFRGEDCWPITKLCGFPFCGFWYFGIGVLCNPAKRHALRAVASETLVHRNTCIQSQQCLFCHSNLAAHGYIRDPLLACETDMFRLRRTSIAIAMIAACTGCSIYPQPDDVTPFESEQIATIIRCQTRDAVRNEIIRQLVATGDRTAFRSMSGYQAAAWFEEAPDRFFGLDWDLFTPNLARLFKFYSNVTVSYDFSIDSSEMNGTGLDLTLLKKLTSGSNSLGIVAKNDRTRQVTRHFRAFDSFDTVTRKLSATFCQNVPRYVNAIFPSTGLLRIGSLVKNFAIENQTGNLGGDKDDFTTAQMADTMVFTTKSVGNFAPSFDRVGVTGVVVPSSIKLNTDNYRQDIHTIIILLQLPVDPSKLPKFDETGRLISVADARKLAKNQALDKEVDYRTQQKIQEISTTLQRATP